MSDQLKDALQFVHGLGCDSTAVHEIGGSFVIVRDGKPISTEEFQSAPNRIRHEVRVTDADSLIGYLTRYRAMDKLAFASASKQAVRVTIDQHEPDEPSWQSHTVELISDKTPEWSALVGVNGKSFSQEEFADWLEEHTHILTEPEAAELIEVALNLQGTVGGKFASRINRSNGSAVFSYEQETTTNQVRVPTRIYVSLRPFEYAALTTVEIHLRFRIVDGRPVFTMVVPQAAKVSRDAFEGLLSNLGEDSGLNIVRVP